MLYRWHCGF